MVAPAVGKYNSARPDDGEQRKTRAAEIGPWLLPLVASCAEARQCPCTSEEGSALKYRQRGYQDRGEESKKRESTRAAGQERHLRAAPIQMPGTRSVSRCSQCGSLLQSLSDPLGHVPSAASNCTPASSALTSIPPAGSSARNPFRNESRARTSATNARFIPCA